MNEPQPNSNSIATLKVQSSAVYVLSEVQFIVRDYAKRFPETAQIVNVALAVLDDILNDEMVRFRKTVIQYERRKEEV